MITLDQSLDKNNQSNQTGQDLQLFFFFLELLSKTDLFLNRGEERGGEGGGGGGRTLIYIGHLSP